MTIDDFFLFFFTSTFYNFATQCLRPYFSKYEFCWIKLSKFEISKAYTIRLQRNKVYKSEFVAKTQFLVCI